METPKITKRTVLLSPGENGYFIAEIPSLLGCISQGKTRQEALELYSESLIKDGEAIPEDSYEIVLI